MVPFQFDTSACGQKQIKLSVAVVKDSRLYCRKYSKVLWL